METVELNSYSELFNSCSLEESSSQLEPEFGPDSQQLVVHSLSDLLGEYVSDDFDITDMVDHYSSSEGDDEVIDIETIDELEGIMTVPDSKRTFPSSSTKFAQYPSSSAPTKTSSRSLLGKRVIVVEKGAGSAFNTNSTIQPVAVPGRARLDSEVVVNDLVALEDKLGGDSGKQNVLEPMLEPFADGSTIIETEIEDDSFSLLGIEGIEADDLESLFLKFEGAGVAVDETFGNAEVANETTVITTPSKMEVEHKMDTAVTSKPKALTLQRYRELRGLSSSAPSTAPSSVPSSPPQPVSLGTDSSQTSDTSSHSRTGYWLTPVDIPESNPVSTSRALIRNQDLSYITLLDHDYCTKSTTQKQANRPKAKEKFRNRYAESQEEENRDYRTEIISLLNQIPNYVGTSLVNLPELISTSTMCNSNRTTEPTAAEPSVLSTSATACNVFSTATSSHKQSITRNPRSLLSTTSVIRPTTSVRSQSMRSSIDGAAKAAVPKCQQLDRECGSGGALPRAYSQKSRRTRHGSRSTRHRRRRWSSPSDDGSFSRQSRRHRKRRYSSSSDDDSSTDDTELYSSSSSDSRSRRDETSDDDSGDGYSSSCSSCYKSQNRSTSRKSHGKRKHKTQSHRHSRKSRSARRKRTCKRGRKRCRRSSVDRHCSQSDSPHSSTSSHRTRSPSSTSSERTISKRRKEAEAAHATAMTERRVVYVGGIGTRYTKVDLRQRFGGFGEIERVTIHTRDNGEDYGFVTFYSKADAYAAIEKGNDVYGPKFNLGFGGRRRFCDTQYADLDGCQAVKEEWATSGRRKTTTDDDFDALLKQTFKKVKV